MTIEAERALLGAALAGYRDLPDLAPLVLAEDFTDPRHGDIWSAALGIADVGGQPDPVTVRPALGRTANRLPGGPTYLVELLAACPHPAQAPEYARQVADAAGRRRLRDVAVAIDQLAHGDAELADAFEDARQRLDEAVRRTSTVIPGRIGTFLPEVLDLIERGTPPGVPTPWPDLNRLITGLNPGSLLVVGARPSNGKSVLGANLACDVALRKERAALLISVEMSRTEVTQRMLAAEASVDLGSVIGARLTDEEWERIAGVTKALNDAPLFIQDDARQTVATIRAAVRDIGRQHPLAVVVVDYLQLLSPRDRRAPREQQVAEISRGLKMIAREQNVCVVALAQVNRASIGRANGRPTLADLRESGAIESDADTVVLLHRHDEHPHRLAVIVAKNRSGPTGDLELLLQGHFARLVSFFRYSP